MTEVRNPSGICVRHQFSTWEANKDCALCFPEVASVRPEIMFRESNPIGDVIVFADEKEVFRNREYRASATWAQITYRLSDPELMAIYRDYKDDYDNISEEGADDD